MIKDGQNVKDSSENPIKDTSSMMVPYNSYNLNPGFYNKTNKLITALYMVTDVMDQNEPLRNKLRTLGAEVVSDIYALSAISGTNSSIQAIGKISEILSFLEIASTINLISQMNANILKKEFIQLRKSIEDLIPDNHLLDSGLSEFFNEETFSSPVATRSSDSYMGHNEQTPRVVTRLGVQKGSTLMKAISDRTSSLSNKISAPKNTDNFDVLKKERRDEIISIIRNIPNSTGATIADIKMKAKGPVATLGDKTLQRELISMLKDNVLYKTGEKRWSRYFLSK